MPESLPNDDAGTDSNELDVFAMDNDELAGEAAIVLLYEIAGVSYQAQRRGFTPQQAIKKALLVLLSENQPQALCIRRYDDDDTVESAKKEAVLAELGSRIARSWEMTDG
jgi:hypothetical protein